MMTLSSLSSESINPKALEASNYGYDAGSGDAVIGTLHHVESAGMGRSFATLVVSPKGADEEAQRRLPLVFLLHGKNKMEVSAAGLRAMYAKARLQEIADLFHVILVAPMLGNTFYLDSPVFPEMRYGTFLCEELPREIDKLLKRESTREQRILCGFSMGGYGAVSGLCRAPETFSIALSRAGAADLAFGVLDLGWDDTIAQEALGSYWTNAKAYRDASCMTLLKRVKGRKDLAFVIEVGVEDFLLSTNRRLREALVANEVPFRYTELPGGHTFDPDAIISLLAAMQSIRPTLPFLQKR